MNIIEAEYNQDFLNKIAGRPIIAVGSEYKSDKLPDKFSHLQYSFALSELESELGTELIGYARPEFKNSFQVEKNSDKIESYKIIEDNNDRSVLFNARMISKALEDSYYTDFSFANVLKDSVSIANSIPFINQHVITNMSSFGKVMETRWAGRSRNFETDGIDGLIRAVRGLKVQWFDFRTFTDVETTSDELINRIIEGIINSVSVTVAFSWKQSHEKMSRDDFLNNLGSKVDGQTVRIIATKILRYIELSLVLAGAIKDAKIYSFSTASDKKIEQKNEPGSGFEKNIYNKGGNIMDDIILTQHQINNLGENGRKALHLKDGMKTAPFQLDVMLSLFGKDIDKVYAESEGYKQKVSELDLKVKELKSNMETEIEKRFQDILKECGYPGKHDKKQFAEMYKHQMEMYERDLQSYEAMALRVYGDSEEMKEHVKALVSRYDVKSNFDPISLSKEIKHLNILLTKKDKSSVGIPPSSPESFSGSVVDQEEKKKVSDYSVQSEQKDILKIFGIA